MKAPLELRKPANWQLFEDLCKKLWGEIWNDKEIQKNGRLGQNQYGVDIFGMPEGENGYYGIQCKGKSDNAFNSHFTEKEVNEEIEKAEAFEPYLKKLYFATTASNDSKVQAFVRKLNVQRKQKGLFEVHLFCWETIVDLIDENRQTHDWYVKSLSYKTLYAIDVSFADAKDELLIMPKFTLLTTRYQTRERTTRDFGVSGIFAGHKGVSLPSYGSFSSKKTNFSYCPISFKIANEGSEAIEDFKLLFILDNRIEGWDDTDDGNEIRLVSKYIPDINFDLKKSSGEVNPAKSILVGGDTFLSDKLFIKPQAKEHRIEVKWKLISKTYQQAGILKITVLPRFISSSKTIIVSNETESKESIEDYIKLISV